MVVFRTGRLHTTKCMLTYIHTCVYTCRRRSQSAFENKGIVDVRDCMWQLEPRGRGHRSRPGAPGAEALARRLLEHAELSAGSPITRRDTTQVLVLSNNKTSITHPPTYPPTQLPKEMTLDERPICMELDDALVHKKESSHFQTKKPTSVRWQFSDRSRIWLCPSPEGSSNLTNLSTSILKIYYFRIKKLGALCVFEWQRRYYLDHSADYTYFDDLSADKFSVFQRAKQLWNENQYSLHTEVRFWLKLKAFLKWFLCFPLELQIK